MRRLLPERIVFDLVRSSISGDGGHLAQERFFWVGWKRSEALFCYVFLDSMMMFSIRIRDWTFVLYTYRMIDFFLSFLSLFTWSECTCEMAAYVSID